jgi:hypothetical protein
VNVAAMVLSAAAADGTSRKKGAEPGRPNNGRVRRSDPEKEPSSMSSIALKVVRVASMAEHRPPERVGPLFRGTGGTDYLCGNCGVVIALGMGPSQRVNVDVATCSACGAENEFPPNLLP